MNLNFSIGGNRPLLLSMTGFGEGHRQQNGLAVVAEVRTINSRYFKLSVRTSDGYASLESQIETVVREKIRRGTVQVNLRIEREPSADDFQINDVVLASYRRQLDALSKSMNISGPTSFDSLLALPGVVHEDYKRHADIESDWPIISGTLVAALEQMEKMRATEGLAMANDLLANCRSISTELEQIEKRAPLVVQAYALRLEERINKLLAEHQVRIEPSDIVREVGIFAERADIAEEVVRLKSHLKQFDDVMKERESVGRKLEFITQEMFRETNTIGSKANDAEIARHVVEIKTAIERMREMIQNVE